MRQFYMPSMPGWIRPGHVRTPVVGTSKWGLISHSLTLMVGGVIHFNLTRFVNDEESGCGSGISGSAPSTSTPTASSTA